MDANRAEAVHQRERDALRTGRGGQHPTQHRAQTQDFRHESESMADTLLQSTQQRARSDPGQEPEKYGSQQQREERVDPRHGHEHDQQCDRRRGIRQQLRVVGHRCASQSPMASSSSSTGRHPSSTTVQGSSMGRSQIANWLATSAGGM